MFGFGNKKNKDGLHTLNEEEIRTRLYGSAVAASEHTRKKPVERKPKKQEPETLSPEAEKEKEERNRLQRELESLQKELETTRKRVSKTHTVQTQQLQAIFTRVAVVAGTIALLVIALMHLFGPADSVEKPSIAKRATKTSPSRPVTTPRYSIQVAVYKNPDAAERLKSALDSRLGTKGYKVSIKKSSYKTGEGKFIVYIG